MTPLKRFIRELRDRAESYGADGALVDGERVYERIANDLEAVLREHRHEKLSVAEAAEESGFAEKTLRRMVREDRIPDSRPPGSQEEIRIQRRDLPRKPGREREASNGAVDRHLQKVTGSG